MNTTLRFVLAAIVLVLILIATTASAQPLNIVHFDFKGKDVSCVVATRACAIDGIIVNPQQVNAVVVNATPPTPQPFPTPPQPPQRRVTIVGAMRNFANGGIFALVVAERLNQEGELEAFWFYFTGEGDYVFDQMAVSRTPSGETVYQDLPDGLYHITGVSPGNLNTNDEITIRGAGTYNLGVMRFDPTGALIDYPDCQLSRGGLVNCDYVLTADRPFDIEFHVGRSSTRNSYVERLVEVRKVTGLGKRADSWQYQLPADTVRGRGVSVEIRAVDHDNPDLGSLSTVRVYIANPR